MRKWGKFWMWTEALSIAGTEESYPNPQTYSIHFRGPQDAGAAHGISTPGFCLASYELFYILIFYPK